MNPHVLKMLTQLTQKPKPAIQPQDLNAIGPFGPEKREIVHFVNRIGVRDRVILEELQRAKEQEYQDNPEETDCSPVVRAEDILLWSRKIVSSIRQEDPIVLSFTKNPKLRDWLTMKNNFHAYLTQALIRDPSTGTISPFMFSAVTHAVHPFYLQLGIIGWRSWFTGVVKTKPATIATI